MTRRALSLLVATFCVAGPAASQQPPAVKPPGTVLLVDKVVAVVGQRPILLSEIQASIDAKRAQGLQMPTDSTGAAALEKTVLDEIIDEEVLIGAAKQYKIEVADGEVQPAVDASVKDVKSKFKTDAEFRDAMKANGFGNESDFRKFRLDLERRQELAHRSIDSLKAHGRLAAPVQVTEEEVNAAFDKNKGALPKRPATITFRQIIVPPHPTPAARMAAYQKAESILVEIRHGADFEKMAKRESMDPGSKEQGGDRGWSRRGGMVPEFERTMFSLPPGAVSDVIETVFGFHIIKVERVQTAEVKARHILIRWHLDSGDVARARLQADTVARLWKGGTPYDSLVARYHDNSEYKTFPDGYPIDQLPEIYKKAVADVNAGGITQPFEIPDPRTGFSKWGVVLVSAKSEGGEFTVADMRDKIRQQLQQEKQYRRMIDQLRREQFVSIRM
jgi:peptidyl-prolyl cis-trans isomerase SurA